SMAEAASEIPEKFFGKYDLDRSENFDEFLAAKGVSWFVRQMIKLAKVSKVLAKNETPGKYNMENLTSKKNTLYHGWELGKTFEAEGLDGVAHKITFSFKDGVLSEHHIRLNDPEHSAETYYYTIENDQLVMKMVNNGITCRRWFKRSTGKK
uniref:Fatty acid-binding protein homolog 3 n=1 Tax=Caenorhabditis elegans TaxID=6239 RepID=UPI00398D6957